MPLSDDQRALLRLLAQREEGYGDIAALMGLSVDEVRSRVKGALNALDEGEPATRGEPSRAAGPVAGRASSSSRDDAAGEEAHPTPPAAGTVPPMRRDQAAPAEAESPLPRTAPRHRKTGPRAAGSRLKLPRDRRRLWEILGGAVVVVLIVLFATGAIDIGGDDDGDDGGALQGQLGAANGKLTQAVLEPVGGGDAEGQALFGRLGKQVVLQVLAQGLEPSSAGENYAIWLYRSPKLSLRVGAVKVGENGKLAARFPVPAELLALVASGSFREVRVTQTANAAYKAEVAAAKRKQRLPRYTGETILSGEIVGPLVKAAG